MNDRPRLVELPGRPAVTRVLVPVAFGALLAGTGAITAVSPPVGLAVGIGAFCTSLLRLGERLRAVFLVVMAGLLIGYAFFGRTFAYLGVPPFYVGEAVLGLGLLSLIPAGRRLEVGKLEWLVIAFAVFGAVRTAPYLGTYGIDALRDAVVWGYALFAFAIANAVEAEHFRRLVGVYRRFLPAFLLWVPIAASITLVAGDAIPLLPGTGVPLLSFKGGDAGVHLAGIGAFVIAGLWAQEAGAFKMLADAAPLALWFVGAAAAGAINRGGL